MPSPDGWYDCTVQRVGPAENGVIYIWLKDNKDSSEFDHWFQAYEGMKREMLATALAAISTGFPVNAWLPSGITQYSQLNRLYLVRP